MEQALARCRAFYQRGLSFIPRELSALSAAAQTECNHHHQCQQQPTEAQHLSKDGSSNAPAGCGGTVKQLTHSTRQGRVLQSPLPFSRPCSSLLLGSPAAIGSFSSSSSSRVLQQQHQQQHLLPNSQVQRRQLHLAPPFLVEDYIPAAATTYRLGRMPAKLEAAAQELQDCRTCPRDCGVNRLKGEMGVCNIAYKIVVSTIAPHYGEEQCLQGWNGSGTVFFSMCNLRCVFCQNWDISQRRVGMEMTPAELGDWMVRLQEEGRCHNVNLVTPEHVAPQVAEAIAAAVEKGLTLPIVYNTSAYDGLPSLKLMDGLVDIYMPDFKFWSPQSAHRYAKARDYPEVAKAAIQEMHRQVGDLVFNADGLAKRGLLLRHLVMPGLAEEAKAIMKWTAQELGRDTFVNLMEQYHPNYMVGKGEQRSRSGWTDYSEIGQRPGQAEVEEVREYARSLGLWRFEEAPRYEFLGGGGSPELAA